jgi:hypothetical protein
MGSTSTRRLPAPRFCARCGTGLARDNRDRWCGACGGQAGDLLASPPVVPVSFWEHPPLRAALDAWHMGAVIHAYRSHPAHGRVLPQEVVAGWLDLTQAQLSRIEAGKAPDELSKLVAWATALRIPPELLWFKITRDEPLSPQQSPPRRVIPRQPLPGGPRPRPPEGSDPVHRREFLGAGAAVAAVDMLTALRPSTAPQQVRREDVEQVEHTARMFTSWDHTYGGGIIRDVVIAQLRWAARLIDTSCPASLRAPLLTAVGYLSGVCGFMAFDAFAHDDGRRMFAFGLACADEAGAWHLRAKLLSHLSRQAIWCGDPDAGLTYAELALVRTDRLAPTEQAMLHTARARALGKLGRTEDTLRAVGAADDAFTQAVPADDPPWMAYYDHAQHHGDTGHALFDLAITGALSPARAIDRLDTAVRQHTDTYARSRAIAGTKLATLTMATGDAQQAAAIGSRALIDAGQLRSRRALTDLTELQHAAAHHAKVPEVASLTHRIGVLVATR